MARLAHELLADIDRETVDFAPNYDGSETEPSVLPARFPNLLVNGTTGIAVGMATNIPPHNLREVIDAVVALIDRPDIETRELLELIPGPDFPTAGIIHGAGGIREAYLTGRGSIRVRARVEIEEDERAGRSTIVVTELPYQVNKARLLEHIAALVKEGAAEKDKSKRKLDDIRALRDESDRDGMRMVIELAKDARSNVVLNQLYQHTALQSSFGINMVALVDGRPRTLPLRDILEAFLRHRREVVTRRTVYDLRRARERAHVLEGLAIALANIDEMIAIIKAASTPAQAREGLMARAWDSALVRELLARQGAAASRPADLDPAYGLNAQGYLLSPVQAQAIVDMRLARLTGLEREKIAAEYRAVLDEIAGLMDILARPERLLEVIRSELVEVREAYGDARRTEILQTGEDFTNEDLIPREDVVVTFSHRQYAKTQPIGEFQAQRRGGKGRKAASAREEDFIERLLVANTHDTLLCFSSTGKAYWLKVYRLPMASRQAAGKPIGNFLTLDTGAGERINAVLPLGDLGLDRYVFMATASGIVKKTPLRDFSNPRTKGIIAVDLRIDDRLIGAVLTDGTQDILLSTSAGKTIRFREDDVRPMQRGACGVRGVRLDPGQEVVSLLTVREGDLLVATENGYGKRTALDEYPVHGRGGQGVITIQTSARNGAMVGAVLVAPDDEVMLVTSGGMLVRTAAAEVSVQGRNTQGVRLINPDATERLVAIERIEGLGETGDSGDEGNGGGEGDATQDL